MKHIITLLLFIALNIQAQEHAWVYFKDKPDATAFLASPNLMLTQRSLDRRTNQGISLNIQDVPVDATYVTAVKNSTGITLKARSRWLNAVHVLGSQTAITNLQNLTSVDSIQFANKTIATVKASKIKKQKTLSPLIQKEETLFIYTYGNASNQTEMVGVDELHDLGYDGDSYQIAIIDSGFMGVNTASAFGHLVDSDTTNGEVLGGYDFVNSSSNFYANTGSTHGTQVLSTIAAIKGTSFTGTAPKASFYLFVTEDAANETPLEESLWVQAAEKADSLGVDIINTSLGYSQFDNSDYDYTYADMDGETTFITRGAVIAGTKGMVMVNSMGNSGNDSWKFLTAPADAANMISVGAVNANETITSFSSFGPSSSGQIKPETLAQGGSVYVVDENDTVKTSNGTSFSGPIIAGVSACLWQAYPEKTSLEIRDLIIENSKLFGNPTNQEGYGVLDLTNISQSLSTEQVLFDKVVSFSKTISDKITFEVNTLDTVEVSVYSISGVLVAQKNINKSTSSLSVSHLSKGIYFVQLIYNGTKDQIKIIKQ
ncbi:S8 family peptidase [Flavobacteriaceae bacterium]|nr:S8 family peptidase [Flavobacteriaceae bacterium]